MASIYEGLARDNDVPKIPVWPLLNTMWQVREGMITGEDAAARFDLDAQEIAELKTIFQNMAGNGKTKLNNFHDFWQLLLAVEHGYIDEATWNTEVGL